MKNYIKNLQVILLIISCLVPLLGQDLITDRPDFTESANTVPLQSWQFEFGYTLARGGLITNHSLGEFLVRYSPLDKIELRFGFNSYLISKNLVDQQGFEDMELGIKWAVIQDSIALLVSTSLPSGSPEFRNDRLQPSITIALAHDINDFLSVGSNLGWTRLQNEDGGWFTEYSASAALGISLSSKLGMFVEYFGFYNNLKEAEDQHYIDGGFTLLITPLFQVDIRVGRMIDNAENYFFGVGAVFRI
jgi:hypothetical protein